MICFFATLSFSCQESESGAESNIRNQDSELIGKMREAPSFHDRIIEAASLIREDNRPITHAQYLRLSDGSQIELSIFKYYSNKLELLNESDVHQAEHLLTYNCQLVRGIAFVVLRKFVLDEFSWSSQDFVEFGLYDAIRDMGTKEFDSYLNNFSSLINSALVRSLIEK